MNIVTGGALYESVLSRIGSPQSPPFGIYDSFILNFSSISYIYSSSLFNIVGDNTLKDYPQTLVGSTSTFLYPFLTSSSPTQGDISSVFSFQQDLADIELDIYNKNPNSPSSPNNSGTKYTNYPDTFLPLQYGDFIRIGNPQNVDSSFGANALYELISFDIGSDYNITSSLNVNRIFTSGSIPTTFTTQNWRIFRRVPNETFVLISKRPQYEGQGLLVPYNFDPRFSPSEIALRIGLIQ
jgi:hypothetical protein